MDRTHVKMFFVYLLLSMMKYALYLTLLIAAGLATWLFALLLEGMI